MLKIIFTVAYLVKDKNLEKGNMFLKNKFDFESKIDTYYVLNSIWILSEVFGEMETMKHWQVIIEEEKESSNDLKSADSDHQWMLDCILKTESDNISEMGMDFILADEQDSIHNDMPL